MKTVTIVIPPTPLLCRLGFHKTNHDIKAVKICKRCNQCGY